MLYCAVLCFSDFGVVNIIHAPVLMKKHAVGTAHKSPCFCDVHSIWHLNDIHCLLTPTVDHPSSATGRFIDVGLVQRVILAFAVDQSDAHSQIRAAVHAQGRSDATRHPALMVQQETTARLSAW